MAIESASHQQRPAYMTIDSVIFDLDGLLVDTERFSKLAFHQAEEAHGLSGHTDLFLSLVGTNDRQHTERLASELTEFTDPVAFRKTWVEAYLQMVNEAPVPLLPGVSETLEWLKQERIKTAVATSSTSDAAKKKLTETDIHHYFDSVTCGDHVSRSKPYPDIYIRAGETISADMSRSIGLEDSANGVKSAHAAGLNVIQVPNVVEPSNEILALGIDVCTSMHDVLDMLRAGEPVKSRLSKS